MALAPQLSKLEAKLARIPVIDPSAEHEIDLLRLILMGAAGTPSQRAALIRIIKQNRAENKNWSYRLAAKIGDNRTAENLNRHSYIVPANVTRRVQHRKRDRERMAITRLRHEQRPRTLGDAFPEVRRTITGRPHITAQAFRVTRLPEIDPFGEAPIIQTAANLVARAADDVPDNF